MLDQIKKKVFLQIKKFETKQHELNYLFWECTARCNLNCLHCGSDCSKNSTYQDMPLKDFLSALDTIKNPAKNFMVVLTGGEPLLREDLGICGREIRKRGMRWAMVSNGHQYTLEKQNELLNAGMGALTISLDGLEKNHNWLRNNTSSFAKVESAIALAASAKRLNFDVVSCVNQRNFKELDAIYDFLLEKGVKAWRLFTIIPIGRAKENKELQVDDAEFKALMDFIASKRMENQMDIKFSCEGYVGEYETKVRDSFFFCRAGINIGSILIDGSIMACPNIDRSFSQGSIYTDNLYEVWNSKYKGFRDRSWTKKGLCSTCSDYSNCQGSGFHNWHGNKETVLVCHNEKLKNV